MTVYAKCPVCGVKEFDFPDEDIPRLLLNNYIIKLRCTCGREWIAKKDDFINPIVMIFKTMNEG